MIFRQLFDPKTFTFTYILGSEKTRAVIIIDPVQECFERDNRLIKELEIDLKYIIETHHPSDHVSGVKNLKNSFPNAVTASPEICDTCLPNIIIKPEDEFLIGEIDLKTISTPGHTSNCVSYYTNGMVFTGDSLLIRSCGRTDQPGGNPELLYDSVMQILFTLPDDTIVYPGHDYIGFLHSIIKEEKLFNPRFCNINKAEFIQFMNEYTPKGNIQSVLLQEKTGTWEHECAESISASHRWMDY